MAAVLLPVSRGWRPLSARLRGEGVRAQRAGKVGVDGALDHAALRHLTLPVALASHGSPPSPRFARRGTAAPLRSGGLLFKTSILPRLRAANLHLRRIATIDRNGGAGDEVGGAAREKDGDPRQILRHAPA